MVSKISVGNVFSAGLYKFVWSHRKLKLKLMMRAMHDVTHSSQPVPCCCLKGSQAATFALNGNFLRQQKEQWKVTNTRSTRFHVVSSWALKPTYQETLLLFCSTQVTTSTYCQHNKGLLLSSRGGNFTASDPHSPESSLEKLLMTIATAGTRELERLEPAFPLPTKLTDSWAPLSPHTHPSHLLKTISCFFSSPTGSSLT